MSAYIVIMENETGMIERETGIMSIEMCTTE